MIDWLKSSLSGPQVGESVVLVPYRRKFVARYHEWMLDPWIRGQAMGQAARRAGQSVSCPDQALVCGVLFLTQR